MKQIDSSHTNTQNPEWQLLEELKLSVNADVNSTISIWLAESFRQIDPQVDFLNKVLISAQEAVANIIQANTLLAFKQLHLLAFVPVNRTAKGQCWGFFRIEKIESVQTDKNYPVHVIEFYLYQEG